MIFQRGESASPNKVPSGRINTVSDESEPKSMAPPPFAPQASAAGATQTENPAEDLDGKGQGHMSTTDKIQAEANEKKRKKEQ